jgi:DNA invertase Pin-like site-specific DNA recombinase
MESGHWSASPRTENPFGDGANFIVHTRLFSHNLSILKIVDFGTSVLIYALGKQTGAAMTRVAIYARVSTGGQTSENQLRELRAVAKRLGHRVAAEFKDNGISGAKGRDQRPGLNSLLDGVTRREFDKVMAWSVDRLGRSLPDLLAFMGELKAKGVDLYLHQQSLDTSTPSGKAMFQMLGVFSEFEREIIRERVCSGLARAKAQGKKLGRPRNNNPKQRAAVVSLRRKGVGIGKIARQLGVGVSYVQRLVAEGLVA